MASENDLRAIPHLYFSKTLGERIETHGTEMGKRLHARSIVFLFVSPRSIRKFFLIRRERCMNAKLTSRRAYPF